jgi:hypothetical protein
MTQSYTITYTCDNCGKIIKTSCNPLRGKPSKKLKDTLCRTCDGPYDNKKKTRIQLQYWLTKNPKQGILVCRDGFTVTVIAAPHIKYSGVVDIIPESEEELEAAVDFPICMLEKVIRKHGGIDLTR